MILESEVIIDAVQLIIVTVSFCLIATPSLVSVHQTVATNVMTGLQ